MAANGTTLLRFDNYPDHPNVSTHHRHTREGIESIDYIGINDHIDRFYEKMDEFHDQRQT